jgi:hypothetical protein
VCRNEQLHGSNCGKNMGVAISESRTDCIGVAGTVVTTVCLNDEPDECTLHVTADISQIISKIFPLIYDKFLLKRFLEKICK